jgi:hypothetical protein
MTPPSWLVTHGGALALGLLVGWVANGWRLGEQIAQIEATAEHERAEAFRWVAAEQTRSAAEMALADTNALVEVRREQEKTDQLRECIERGTGCGLRVKVTRSAACVSAAGPSAGVGDRGGEWAELDADARRDYLALRARLPVVEQALKLCVDRYPK